jgi:hypothetical protein
MVPNLYELERRMHDDMERNRLGAAHQERVDLARQKEPRDGNWIPWRARRRARVWGGR